MVAEEFKKSPIYVVWFFGRLFLFKKFIIHTGSADNWFLFIRRIKAF